MISRLVNACRRRRGLYLYRYNASSSSSAGHRIIDQVLPVHVLELEKTDGKSKVKVLRVEGTDRLGREQVEEMLTYRWLSTSDVEWAR